MGLIGIRMGIGWWYWGWVFLEHRTFITQVDVFHRSFPCLQLREQELVTALSKWCLLKQEQLILALNIFSSLTSALIKAVASSQCWGTQKGIPPPTTALTPHISSDLKFPLSIHCSLRYTNKTPTHQPLPDHVLCCHKATLSIIRHRGKLSGTLSILLDLAWKRSTCYWELSLPISSK